jgi:DMSO/TMAO reductase YedYZ molybdopterin-dependent catalytic subunit
LPTISLTGAAGEKATITAAEIATMPRTTITVFDAHTKVEETFSGVLLTDALARVHAPLGEKLHGKAMSIRVIAEGSDHYTALYSLAEVDPAFHPGTVIIADTMDGKPLPPSHGPLQLVNTEDKRPARWVRQLVAIRLVSGD